MQITIKGDELDSIQLIDVDKDTILDNMRDELHVLDENGDEIDLEDITEAELSLTFKKKFLIENGVTALIFHKLLYVETKCGRYVLGVDDVYTSYIYNGVYTIVTWGCNHVFNLEKNEHKTFHTR